MSSAHNGEATPPKPRLILRIGVTGHRPNNFPQSARANVCASLAAIFARIDGQMRALHARNKDFFAPDAPEIRIVSALAEGADRVVVHAALEAGFVLDVVLPFAPQTYEEDFTSPASRAEFHGLLSKARACLALPGETSPDDPDKANRAYESAGLMTLRQCDLLIAIWDGKGSSGRGGTQQIVQRAVLSRIPVLRFDAAGEGPYALVAEGQETADAVDLAIRSASEGPVGEDDIAAMIEDLVSPPRGKPGIPADYNALLLESRKMLLRFLAERERHWLLTAFSYPLLLAAFAGKSGFLSALRMKPYLAETAKDWAAYWQSLPPGDIPLSTRVGEIVMTRFAWADNLANYYGQLHRSGYVANFALSAMAVACAVIAIISHDANNSFFGLEVSPLSFALIELAITLAIILQTMVAVAWQWHQRWLDYRQLSEQLRHLRALALTGSSAGESRLPHSGDAVQPGSIWATWYYSATCREVGMPEVIVDQRYVDAARDAIARGELEGQIRYHQANAARMARIERSLKLFGEGSFVVTSLFCVLELVAPYFPLLQSATWEAPVSALSVILPAIGASAFAIRVQGDFEGSAARSEEMWQRLQRIQARMSRKAISFSELSSLTEEAAATMTLELGDFSFIYRSRPLALPA